MLVCVFIGYFTNPENCIALSRHYYHNSDDVIRPKCTTAHRADRYLLPRANGGWCE